MRCPTCKKAEMLEAREEYPYVESGIPDVTLKNIIVRRCTACGEVMPKIPKISQLRSLMRLPGKGPIQITFSIEGNCWIRRGGFSGSKITSASTAEVEKYADIASEFMLRIFDMTPDQYAISDESILSDMVGRSEEPDTVAKIEAEYGFTPSTGTLLGIFREIQDRR